MPDGIVFVSPWLRDGGVETSIQVMLPWLARHGHRVALLSWEIEERLAGRTNPVLVTLRESGIPVRKLRGRVRLHLIQYAAQTALFLKRGGYRVVVGHELFGNIVAVLANFLLSGRLHVICTVHSSSDIYGAVGTKPLLVRLGRALYRRAHGVVAPTDGVRRDAISFFGLDPSRVVTAHLPFALGLIRRLAMEPNDLSAGDSPPVVLGCGRLVKMKGFPDLLQAFRLAREEIAATLVILGDGPERDELSSSAKRLGIASDVRMPGFVTNPFPYFRRANAFVLS
jgi:glycosyltransferase involved in cell wall biosynthesis